MLRLRPYNRRDAEIIVRWIKDEVTFRKWSADQYEKYPVAAEDINRYYAEHEEAGNFFEMTAFDESGPAGHMIMRFTDEEQMVLRFGFVIVDDSRRGMGYGREMLTLALEYAFGILKVEKVTLGVFENNENAHRCYTALGFREAQAAETVAYSILGEEWNCIELEMERSRYIECRPWLIEPQTPADPTAGAAVL